MKRFLFLLFFISSLAHGQQTGWFDVRSTAGGNTTRRQLLATDVSSNFLRSNATNTFAGTTTFDLGGYNFDLIAADNAFRIKNASDQIIFQVSGAQAQTITQSPGDNSTKVATTAYVDTGLATKQATLVSGTNIKTINGSSVLGSGDITVGYPGPSSGTPGQQLRWDSGGTALENFTPISDPLTTLGDLPYRGSSTWERLGIGSSNQILKVIGGIPSWQDMFSGVSTMMPYFSSATAISATGSSATGQGGVWDNTNGIIDWRRSLSSTNAAINVLQITSISTGDMADGFGPMVQSKIRDAGGGVDNVIGRFGHIRSGADNSGKFALSTVSTGSETFQLNVTPGGLWYIGNGTTSSTAKFTIRAPGSSTNTNFRLEDSGGNLKFFVLDNGQAGFTGTLVRFDNGTTNAGSLRIREDADNGTNEVTVEAPANLAGDVRFQLPGTNGSLGQMLSTNGSGNTSWQSAPYYAMDVDNTGTSYSSVLSSSLSIPNNSAYLLVVSGTGVKDDGSEAYSFSIESLIRRSSGGTYTVVGTSPPDVKSTGVTTATVSIVSSAIQLDVTTGISSNAKNNYRVLVKSKIDY